MEPPVPSEATAEQESRTVFGTVEAAMEDEKAISPFVSVFMRFMKSFAASPRGMGS